MRAAVRKVLTRRLGSFLLERVLAIGVVRSVILRNKYLADNSLFRVPMEVNKVKRAVANGRHWLNAQASGTRRPRILIISMRGNWTAHLLLEGTLAYALMLRGAECLVFTCSGGLPICEVTPLEGDQSPPCRLCHGNGAKFLKAFRLPYEGLEKYVSQQEIKNAVKITKGLSPSEYELFEYEGLPIGKIARISTRWFLRSLMITSGQPYSRYIASSIVIVAAANRLLAATKPDAVLLVNGLFHAENVITRVAHRNGIRVINYELGFLHGSYVFSQDEPANYFENEEAWERFRASHTRLSTEEDRVLDNYLKERERGTTEALNFPIWEHLRIDHDSSRLRTDSQNRRVAVLFTNVSYDSAVQDRDEAFRDMFDWISSTVEYFAQRPELFLVVRVHPSEIPQRSNEATYERLKDRYPSLPSNVRVLKATDPLSSYDLFAIADVGLVYTSTIGLEMATKGIPVVVAAKTHYRGKGFTHDVHSKDEYLDLLERWPFTKRNESLAAVARSYAYFLFFKSMIVMDYAKGMEYGRPTLNFVSLEDLVPGKNATLDRVCACILTGKPFVR